MTEGTGLKLKCRFTGAPTPRVIWLKDGLPLRPDFRLRVKDKRRRSILRLSDVTRRDAGKYTCSALNVLGENSLSTDVNVRFSAPDFAPASKCPIESFCLNGGECSYYEMIGELVCRCEEGFAGQRCQFKKATISLPFLENDACGPYGHDIHLQEICAAWKRPPVTEMSVQEYGQWLKVEEQLRELKRQKDLEQMRKFREMAIKPKHKSRVKEKNNHKDSATSQLSTYNRTSTGKGILEESYAYSDEEYYDEDYIYSGYNELKFQKEGLANEESRNNV